MKHRILAILTPLLLVAALGIGTVARAELPVINGEYWMASDSDSKLAFLMGMATMVKVEQNLLGDPPPPGTVSFAPAIAKGIGDMTLTEVMNRVDALYADNPDRMDEAVIALIWQEIAIPRIEASE
ncbi:MAG: hypothetical protein U9Q71_06725 [Pseudomonadota bacterium]|nr:hypothetical protein [Pseudomonadota bacterium]